MAKWWEQETHFDRLYYDYFEVTSSNFDLLGCLMLLYKSNFNKQNKYGLIHEDYTCIFKVKIKPTPLIKFHTATDLLNIKNSLHV